MPERIENRMVVDSEWVFNMPAETRQKLHGPGRMEMGTGNFVPEEDAFDHALERISHGTEKEKQEFVEWFYSGDWIKED